MTNKEKAIKYLKQYKALDNLINSQIEERMRWHSLATKTTPLCTNTPCGADGGDKIQISVENILELEEDINRNINKLIRLKKSITNKINGIEELRLRLILKYKYIDGFTFEKIAEKTSYSWRQIVRLHDEAIQKINMS